MEENQTSPTPDVFEPRRGNPLLKGVIIAVALLVLGLFAVPGAALMMAKSQLASEPCDGSAGDAAPVDRFYSASSILDTVGSLPWFEGAAMQASTDAAVACMQSFTASCSAIRDEAIADAREAIDSRGGSGAAPGAPRGTVRVRWADQVDDSRRDAFCEEWGAWIDWVGEHELDPYRACPICGTAPVPAGGGAEASAE